MSSDRNTGRRFYMKPQLREISLAGDEVLGTSCKTATPATQASDNPPGPFPPPGSCVAPTPCNLEGS